MKFILGLKLGMSQIFDKNGKIVPITLIEAGPCQITQIKKDNYDASQIGFIKLKDKKIKKPQKQKPFRYLREFRGNNRDNTDVSKYKVGDEINTSIFQEGDVVEISGISKGKGFAGVVKKWGFAGRNSTHGVKHESRKAGSIGSSFPERVTKGKKMAGRLGNQRVTIKNLKIVKIDSENNLLAIKGAIPGSKGTLLEIRGK